MRALSNHGARSIWLALACAVALFAVTNLVGGSGYLAVYLAGIVVAAIVGWVGWVGSAQTRR